MLRGLPAYSFSLFAILALSAITISDSILAIDVTLNRQNVHLLCILISTHLLHFMTVEIASILRQCFDLVNYSLSSVGGLHASSSCGGVGGYCCLEAHSFPRASLSENCSLLGTDNREFTMQKNLDDDAARS